MTLSLRRAFRFAGLFAVAAFAVAAQAQGTGTITGTVVDADTGDPLPVANVIILDTGNGAATGIDGQFTIEDVDARAQPYRVRASFTGYEPVELPANVETGGTVVLNFELGTRGLDEVVVTSLGIERQERELGYSVSEVRGDETEVGDDSNFLNALSGKIPGLDISSQSGNVGGSTRVILRGITSLEGDQQPLFVVDGVPISNNNVSSGSRITGAIDTGNRALDINPNDIQTVSVLKGGAAAALYGQRARNGVILITTKRGVQRSGTSIQVSSGVYGSDTFRLPEFQNEYAPGDAGIYDPADQDGWGPRIQGQTVRGYILDPLVFDPDAETADFQEYTLTSQPDNVNQFFQTGTSLTNSLAFSTATDKTDLRVGITNVDQGGIIPGSDLGRTTVTANLGARLDNNFTVRLSGNYVNSSSLGRVASGGNDPTVVIGDVVGLPRTLATSDLRTVFDAQGVQRSLGNFTNNPFFNVEQNPYETGLDRVYGQATVGYDPLDWLNFTARIGTDVYTENRQRTYSVGTIGREDGEFQDDIIESNEVNVDGFATANRQVGESFSIRALAGFNVNERQFERRFNTAEQLSVPGLYTFANAQQNSPSNFRSIRRLYGFYGDITFGYNDVVFLNVTGRNDYTSTLPEDNRSYFYPSANLSVVFSDLLNVNPAILSYGKIRLNAARVGSDTDPYQLAFSFNPLTSVFGQYSTGPNFPYLGLNGFDATDVIPPLALRPQQQDTYEAGLELSFLNERVSLDGTVYTQKTSDQILEIPVSFSTGFQSQVVNVGEIQNRGFEALLNAVLFDAGGVSFDARVNFQQNRNEVLSLVEGVDEYLVQSGFNSFQIRAEEGEPLGIYGTGFERDPATGLPVIDPNTGLRQPTAAPIRLGDVDPDFRVGFGNTLRFRNRAFGDIQIGALIDWRQGGSIFSGTVNSLRRQGLVEETTINREGTFIDNGVIVVSRDADGEITETRPNDVPVENMEEFWGAYAEASIIEGGVFDASYVKLREITLGYSFPDRLLRSTPFGRATLTLEARNLALLYSKVPHIDPETNIFGSGAIGSGYEFFNVPSTRTYGVSLNFSF